MTLVRFLRLRFSRSLAGLLVMASSVMASLVAASWVAPSRAEEPPDLGKYECTRTDGGKGGAGDELARQGFEIIARARFGNANLMMVEPKSSVRANCFLRPPK